MTSMAFYGPTYYHDYYGPYGLDQEEIARHDAWRELRTLINKANILLCSLYKIPQHKSAPKIDLLQSSEVILHDSISFQIFLHAEGFRPGDIKIQEVGGRLIVRGSHDEREDEHGFIERSFVRTYLLPKDVDAKQVVARLTPEGFLAIEAAKHKLPERPAARSIPVRRPQHASAIAQEQS